MSFYETIESLERNPGRFGRVVAGAGPALIERVLSRENLSPDDLALLLAPEAASCLEPMAEKARLSTLRNFGRTIALYTPLYLSNYCVNNCLYCGFNVHNRIPRSKLGPDELRREAEAVAGTGLKHVLILTGECRMESPVSYLAECIGILRSYFSSISIEIYPLAEEEYCQLIDCGVDGLTVYQEVYDRPVYGRLHPGGPKKDYRYRLEAPERAGRAGMRTINIGALLGLHDWRREVFALGLHAAYLQKSFGGVEIGVSFPRLRPQVAEFEPYCTVTDAELVQMILALRLFLPRVGITVSTRESAAMRDNLIRLGVTRMSAGSSTAVGGRTGDGDSIGQFEIADHRSVAEMAKAIDAAGYQPVFKDWQVI